MFAYGGAVFFGALVPIRIAEWYFFLWLLYRGFNFGRRDLARFISTGVVVSFVLDLVAGYAMVNAPGGLGSAKGEIILGCADFQMSDAAA